MKYVLSYFFVLDLTQTVRLSMQLGLIQEVVPWECRMYPISRSWWVLNKDLLSGEAPPRGPTPPFYHPLFKRTRIPFV